MRRLVLPLLVFTITGLLGPSVFGQTPVSSIYDTLTFGNKIRDTIRCAKGDTFDLPIYVSTDSTISALSAVIGFDKDILWPVLVFDSKYQALIDLYDDSLADLIPDSTDWQVFPAYDSGLWHVVCSLTAFSKPTWNLDYGAVQTFHNLRSPDTMRFLLAPNTNIPPDPTTFIPPYIPGNQNGGKGAAIAWLRFWVNPAVDSGTSTYIRYLNEDADGITTEFAQEWDSLGDSLTKRVIPTLMPTLFIAEPPCDTCDHEDTLTNDPPVLTLGTAQTVFDIKQGEQVSFTVTATDAEGGEVRITANNGNLPPNANMAPSNPAIGGGGMVTASFSFKPDITQQGSFAFSFVALDDSGATSDTKAVTVTVAELDIDRLFTASNDSLKPEGGVPGLPEVLVPINVVSKKTIYGIQFDMDYNATNFDLDSIVTTDRIPDWIVYDNIGATPGSVRVVTFGLANDPMVAGTSSAILFLAFTVDEFATIAGYPLDIYNGWESIDPDPNMPSLELVTGGGVLYVDQWGDVNLDRRIDVADLVNVVSYIIGTYGLSRRQFAAADIVINDTVNVVDLVGVINTIFGWPVTPAPSAPWQGDYALLRVFHDEVPAAGMESEMQINADMPDAVAGVELDIQYNPNSIEMLTPGLAPALLMAPDDRRFTLRCNDDGHGHMKVLIYSSHPWNEEELIREGLSDIVKLPFISKGPIAASDNGQLRITRAFVSTGSAKNIPVEGVGGPALPTTFALFQNRPNPFNPSTIIDFNINGSDPVGGEHVRLEVFNLLGQLVKILVDEQLPAGQHSVVWDGTDKYGDRVASGIYLYRLRVGDESATKKMMLLK